MGIVREDWSAIEALDQHFISRDKAAIEERLAPLRVAEKKAAGEFRFKSGIALLATGLGIGAAAFGLSFVIPPRIIEKPVVTEKLVYVDKPIITERVVTVDKPIVTERLIKIPTPVPSPAPEQQPIAKPRTEQQFTEQQAFKDAEYHGIIESYLNGNITFRGGRTFYHSRGNVLSYRPELIGKQAYCEEFNSQEHRYHCYAWVNGKSLGI